MKKPNMNRLAALIARAAHASTPAEEARTAAHAAVRLMRESGMVDGAGAFTFGASTADRDELEAVVRQRDSFRREAELAARAIVAAQDVIAGQKAVIARLEREARTPKAAPASQEWRFMTSRFYAACRLCGETIVKGSPIAWRKADGARHEACHHAAEKETHAA